jgi:hypothetical protein
MRSEQPATVPIRLRSTRLGMLDLHLGCGEPLYRRPRPGAPAPRRGGPARRLGAPWRRVPEVAR